MAVRRDSGPPGGRATQGLSLWLLFFEWVSGAVCVCKPGSVSKGAGADGQACVHSGTDISVYFQDH